MPFLPPNQQRQSTAGSSWSIYSALFAMGALAFILVAVGLLLSVVSFTAAVAPLAASA